MRQSIYVHDTPVRGEVRPFPRSADEKPDLLASLKAVPNWVGWKYVEAKGRLTKPPINVRTGRRADATDPATWADFDAARRYVEAHGLDGVGFCMCEALGMTAVDLDDCHDPAMGEITAWAWDVLHTLGFPRVYVEVSPSGTGLRLFVRGVLPERFRCVQIVRDAAGDEIGRIEAYTCEHYLTVSFDRLPHCTEFDVADGGDRLIQFGEKYLAANKPPTTPPAVVTKPATFDLPTDWIAEKVARNRKSSVWWNGGHHHGEG